MNKNEIRKILEEVDSQKYSHILICIDTFEYDYFVKYVERENDIDDFIENFWKEHRGGMFKIEEIYNLDLDIKMQLNESNTYHVEKAKKIEPIKKEGKVDNQYLLNRALEFATEKHKGQMRKGKNPKEYITHPINVAKLILRYKGDAHNINILRASAYLHDTIEDTDTTYHDLVKIFGYEIANLVYELTTNEDMKKELGKAGYLAIKMKNMSNDALVIKLCDRLDNISELNKTDSEFRDKYVNETLYIIKYTLENRKLTNTHLDIIKTILIVLEIIIINVYDDNSKETHGIMALKNTIKAA